MYCKEEESGKKSESSGFCKLPHFSLFCDKYPHLALQLPISQLQENKEPGLKVFETLYNLVYLIGTDALGEAAFMWLQHKTDRKIVVIENDLEKIAYWLFSPYAAALLKEEGFRLVYLPQNTSIKSVLSSLVFESPADSFEVLISPSYVKTKKALAKEIKHTLYEASFQITNSMKEVLHSDIILKNYLSNLQKAYKSFSLKPLKGKFEDIPIILCGAGPSLDESLPFIQRLQDKALIIACGSAISVLSKAHIIPHFAVAIDPNPLEYRRLKQRAPYRFPLIHFLRLRYDVLDLFEAPNAVIPTIGLEWMIKFEKCLLDNTKEIVENMDIESSSVITLGASFATYLGACSIVLCGVDLGFSEGKTYSQGVDLKEDYNSFGIEDTVIKAKGINKGFVSTALKWSIEAKALSRFIKKQKDSTFYNTSYGIKIEGAKKITFEDLCQNENFEHKKEVLKRVQTLTCQKKASVDEAEIKRLLFAYSSSLQKSRVLLKKIEEILLSHLPLNKEEIEIFFVEEQLLEEIFYKDFLAPIRFSLKLIQNSSKEWAINELNMLLEKLDSFSKLF